jgi:hypothetical protein
VCYSGGAQRVMRSQDGFASLLAYPSGSSAVITTASDEARAAVCKMGTHGRALVAVVPCQGRLDTYVSRDDGATWSQAS